MPNENHSFINGSDILYSDRRVDFDIDACKPRKLWKDSVFDEAVYISESFTRNSQIRIPFAKLYRERRVWLEIEFILFCHGNTYLKSIFTVEGVKFGRRTSRHKGIYTDAIDGNDAMLVDIAERIQLP